MTSQTWRRSTEGTLYRAFSADASTAYGLSPAFVVHDELGLVRGPRSELFEALESGSAAQLTPLSVIISTQAPTDNDLLSIIIDDAPPVMILALFARSTRHRLTQIRSFLRRSGRQIRHSVFFRTPTRCSPWQEMLEGCPRENRLTAG